MGGEAKRAGPEAGPSAMSFSGGNGADDSKRGGGTQGKPSSQAKWNRAHPLELWAHQALRSAIRKGLTERGPCEVCGAVHGINGARVDGHHDDYSKPMAVRWLCRKHHLEAHRRTVGRRAAA